LSLAETASSAALLVGLEDVLERALRAGVAFLYQLHHVDRGDQGGRSEGLERAGRDPRSPSAGGKAA